jgi:hypothetical protein
MASEDNVGAKRALDLGKPPLASPTNSEEGPDGPPTTAVEAGLSEDAALALLRRPDLPADVLERLAKNGNVLKHRKVKLALVEHPKTPRHVSLPLVRQLYAFDLMQVALTPAVPADVKLAADEALCNRMETISSGEKLTLAHRASGRVAGELLLDAELRVVQAALQNSRLTEASIVRALVRPGAPVALVEQVAHHPQWSLRCEVRVALLRNEKTPMARAVEFARGLPVGQLREILQGSRLPGNVKSFLLAELAKRATGKRPG